MPEKQARRWGKRRLFLRIALEEPGSPNMGGGDGRLFSSRKEMMNDSFSPGRLE